MTIDHKINRNREIIENSSFQSFSLLDQHSLVIAIFFVFCEVKADFNETSQRGVGALLIIDMKFSLSIELVVKLS